MLSLVQEWLIALCDPEGPQLELAPRAMRAARLPELGELARRHGVAGCVAENLHSLAPVCQRVLAGPEGGEALARLADDLRRQAALAAGVTLGLRAQTAELMALLGRRGLSALVLKGADFASRLYPRAGLRMYVDVDLLVPACQAEPVADALRSLGYLQAGSEGKYRGGYGESAWIRPDQPGSGTVELHWDLVNSPTVRQGLSVTYEDIPLDAGASPPRPSPAGMLLVAGVHAAASHMFDRLTLLNDVRQIVRGRAGRIDGEILTRACRRTNASFALAAALELTALVFRDEPCRLLAPRLELRCPPWLGWLISPGVILRGHAYRDSFRRQIARQRLKRGGGMSRT